MKEINLDSILTPKKCSQWLGITERTLLKNARSGKIPVIRLNERVLRFHPRTILAAKSANGPSPR